MIERNERSRSPECALLSICHVIAPWLTTRIELSALHRVRDVEFVGRVSELKVSYHTLGNGRFGASGGVPGIGFSV